MLETNHLQNEEIFVAFVPEHAHVILVKLLNFCLQLALLQMQQQVESLGVVLPVQKCLLQVPEEIPVT